MDYDSSTKFISSLAKFLQSLCNGYVEFDSGVQVIGHLYLSVDTGKTIDYILNEKVCKTDENSVTFISNSFHAQPAEKPKPPGKKTPKEADKVESKLEDSDSYNGAPTELSSTNVGTVPSRNISSPHAVKRPLSPSLKQSKVKSGRSSPKHKKSRNEQADHNAPSQHSNQANENSVSSVPSPSDSIPLHSEPVAGVDNESYPHGFFNPDEEHSLVSDSDERDIKPNIDTDVTFIKEEFAANSGSSQSHDRSHDDPSGYSYQSNPVFPGGYLGASGFGTSPRSNYAASSSSQMYSSNSGPHSKEEGPGDSSGPLNLGADRNTCQPTAAAACTQGSCPVSDSLALTSYLGTDNNFLAWAHRRMSYPPRALSNNMVPGFGAARSQENMGLASSLAAGSSTTFRRQSRDIFGNPLFSTCCKCGGKYTNAGICASHQANCNGINRLKCHICQRVYSQMCALKEHLRGKHGLGELLTCKFCGRSFKYKPQLYDHSCTGINAKERNNSHLMLDQDSSLPDGHDPGFSDSNAVL